VAQRISPRIGASQLRAPMRGNARMWTELGTKRGSNVQDRAIFQQDSCARMQSALVPERTLRDHRIGSRDRWRAPLACDTPNSGEHARERGATTGRFGERRFRSPLRSRREVGWGHNRRSKRDRPLGPGVRSSAMRRPTMRDGLRIAADRCGSGVPRPASSTGSAEPAPNANGVPPDASRARGRPLGSPEPPRLHRGVGSNPLRHVVPNRARRFPTPLFFRVSRRRDAAHRYR